MKHNLILGFLVFGWLLFPFQALSDEQEEQPEPTGAMEEDENIDREYLPTVKVNPYYPREAVIRGIEGAAVVEYTVDAEGYTKDVELVAEFPPGFGFGRTSMNAAKQYQYKPRIINGEPVEVEGVRTMIFYNFEGSGPNMTVRQGLSALMEPDLTNPDGNYYGLEADGETFNPEKYLPIYTPTYDFTKKAKREGVRGKVKIQFTVKSDGTVDDVIILEESPKGYGFGDLATRMTAQSFYLPLKIGGKPVEVREMIREFDFCEAPKLVAKHGRNRIFQPATCPHS